MTQQNPTNNVSNKMRERAYSIFIPSPDMDEDEREELYEDIAKLAQAIRDETIAEFEAKHGDARNRALAECGEVRNRTIEECAKIAKNGPPPGSIVRCDGDVRDPGVVVTGYMCWIENKILALKTPKFTNDVSPKPEEGK